MASESAGKVVPENTVAPANHFRQGGAWRLVSYLGGEAESLALLSVIEQGEMTFTRVFRDNRRTLSARIETDTHGGRLCSRFLAPGMVDVGSGCLPFFAAVMRSDRSISSRR